LNVLITGARAPVSVELARCFSLRGDLVFLADSIRNCIGRFTNSKKRFFVLPSPVHELDAYVDELNIVVEKHRIELIIPVCEEVFFLARMRDRINCRVLSDDIEKLSWMHSKWEMTKLAGNEYASVPETLLIDNAEGFKKVDNTFGDWVLKPVYSRFASKTLVGPSNRQVSKIEPGKNAPWICQKRVVGQEYSTYSVAIEGQLVAHGSYVSKYRAGVGSGIYFLNRQHQAIEKFVSQFVTKNQFSGQIGFDIIEDKQGELWVIEINPRATSGGHLFRGSSDLANAIINPNPGVLRPLPTTSPLQVMFAMPVWGVSSAFRNGDLWSLIPDFFRARDVLFRLNDPMPAFVGVPMAMVSLWFKSLRENCSLQDATTSDIEYNGNEAFVNQQDRIAN